MIRVLATIAAAAFVLSIACLAVAIRLAGPEFIEDGMWGWSGGHGWNWDNHGWSWTWSDNGPESERDIAWTGGDTLELDLPAHVRFTQGDGPAKLSIRGPRSALKHVVLQGDRLTWDRPGLHFSDVSVEMTAPKVTHFAVNGSGELEIDAYSQDKLALDLNGSGDVSARGTAKVLQVNVAGSGEADLGELASDSATVTISGSGDAHVAPKTNANLTISGSGDVTLNSRPPHVQSDITGSGHVKRGDGSSEGQDHSDDGDDD